MSTYVERIQAQIDKANTATGKDDSTLVQAVQSLVDGYGAGGGDSGAEDMLKGLIERSATEITIPDSVTSIGDNAFYKCSKLANITIPDSVKTIGNSAFQNCSQLASVTIPNGVTSIGDNAFRECSQLASVTIPNSVTSIGGYAFYTCSKLASITIPNGVNIIGSSAFQKCSQLASVTIPNSVTSIGGYAFYNINANAVITCKFAEGAVRGAPWGAPSSVKIVYDPVYTVYFYNGDTLLQTVTDVPTGGTATYTGDEPTDANGNSFSGWMPLPTNITADTSCYAQFGST